MKSKVVLFSNDHVDVDVGDTDDNDHNNNKNNNRSLHLLRDGEMKQGGTRAGRVC